MGMDNKGWEIGKYYMHRNRIIAWTIILFFGIASIFVWYDILFN